MIILTSNIVIEVTLMLPVSENLFVYQLRLLYPFRTIILIPLYNCGCEMYREINRFYTYLIWFSSLQSISLLLVMAILLTWASVQSIKK